MRLQTNLAAASDESLILWMWRNSCFSSQGAMEPYRMFEELIMALERQILDVVEGEIREIANT